MKTLYNASNALEAHMLRDLLRQEGVDAHIHGEALQGAIGEMPAAGLIRLMVHEHDYDAGRGVIERWESAQIVEEEPAALPRPPAARKSFGLWPLLAGVVIGVGLTYAAYRAPASVDGMDYNRDGVLDERWTYSPIGIILTTEIDRNLDSKVDFIVHHGARGLPTSAQADDNFDGTFESQQGYVGGNVGFVETDRDGDGHPDLRWTYDNGVLDTIEYLQPASASPVRVEHHELGRLAFADVDTDRDGVLDVRIRYSDLAEAVSREHLAR